MPRNALDQTSEAISLCSDASNPVASSHVVDAASLPRSARDFRRRFVSALEALVAEAMAQIEHRAEKSGNEKAPKVKINVSAVLKRAGSSPLTAYSPLHRDVLLPLVENESLRVKEAESRLLQTKSKPTILSLQQELREAKERYEKSLARLASQQLTNFVGKIK